MAEKDDPSASYKSPLSVLVQIDNSNWAPMARKHIIWKNSVKELGFRIRNVAKKGLLTKDVHVARSATKIKDNKLFANVTKQDARIDCGRLGRWPHFLQEFLDRLRHRPSFLETDGQWGLQEQTVSLQTGNRTSNGRKQICWTAFLLLKTPRCSPNELACRKYSRRKDPWRTPSRFWRTTPSGPTGSLSGWYSADKQVAMMHLEDYV